MKSFSGSISISSDGCEEGVFQDYFYTNGTVTRVPAFNNASILKEQTDVSIPYFDPTYPNDNNEREDQKMIYHYTTIDSLAMILESKRLLFKRLDCMDDIEEGGVVSSGIRIGKYVFVSCWTESSEEIIPLWKMYANGKEGVRIGLKKDMFKKYLYHNPVFGNQQWYGSMSIPISMDQMQNPEYFVSPDFDLNRGYFYREVQYVDDVKEKTKNAVIITGKDNKKINISISFGEIGRYKNKRWSFQKESRFVLTILPFNPMLENTSNLGMIAVNSYLQNKPIRFDKIYLDLDQDVLSEIEITLSPEAGEAQRIVVESLAKLYAPGANIQFSSLRDCVRFND